jgi:hypothetical protein
MTRQMSAVPSHSKQKKASVTPHQLIKYLQLIVKHDWLLYYI